MLSPCAFIASNYVLLGRLARHLRVPHHLLVPARRITLLFLSSDISTFLVQAAGGALSIAANDAKTNKTGADVFLAGLALQLASFATFSAVYARWLWRVRTREPAVWARDAGLVWWRDWRALAGALVLSCVGILVSPALIVHANAADFWQIRSVYRTIELSQGFEGHLATIEAYFYALDTLPLFLAVAVYVPFWPGRFVPPGISALAKDGEAGSGEAAPVHSTGTVVENEGSVEKQG